MALDLALRGKGDFPFDTSDPTSGNAAGLAQANDWWGAASCPRSIIVVAGDTFADALAAAPLSDPTDRSGQPRLQRVAAADPSFDPIGGFDRPDTAYAPIVVTTSARAGATTLAPTALLTATDLVKGGCTTAREAIIVGGTSAVPAGVESQLIAAGYREVFRVAGTDRYDTAARVAGALGTAAPSSATCTDPRADDGSTRLGWYGNAAVEYRSDPTQCQVLSRAVVLAEGGTGADALAAGWWTSWWQVPVLLTAPDGSLPPATQVALQAMDIDTVIVLGGTARVPESTVDEARRLAGAIVGRIAGADRTSTSIEMAKAFGGWRPTGKGTDFADDVVCFAPSGPDALAAGPVCARIGAAAGGSPVRALPPVTGAGAATASTGRNRPSHDAVPVIVLPVGSSTLPSSVSDFLDAAFAPDAPWCSVDLTSNCIGPGFGVIVGGTGVVPESEIGAITDLVSGGHAADLGDRSPRLDSAFPTSLDLSPVFGSVGGASGVRLCVGTGDMKDVRWLSVTSDVTRQHFLTQFDVLRAGRYGAAGTSLPTCGALESGFAGVAVAGVSMSGRTTAPTRFVVSDDGHVTLSAPIVQSGGTPAGGSTTRWSFRSPPGAVDIRQGSTGFAVTGATLDLQLSLAADPTRARAVGTATVTTANGTFTGRLTGDAVRVGSTWEVRGRCSTAPFPGGPVVGGFSATLVADGDGGGSSVSWRFDGY